MFNKCLESQMVYHIDFPFYGLFWDIVSMKMHFDYIYSKRRFKKFIVQ